MCTVIQIPVTGFEIRNSYPVVHKMDSAIHRINHYPLDRDLSGG